jgi:hypothetical protein
MATHLKIGEFPIPRIAELALIWPPSAKKGCLNFLHRHMVHRQLEYRGHVNAAVGVPGDQPLTERF